MSSCLSPHQDTAPAPAGEGHCSANLFVRSAMVLAHGARPGTGQSSTQKRRPYFRIARRRPAMARCRVRLTPVGSAGIGQVTANLAVSFSGHWYADAERSAAQFLASRRAASIAWASASSVLT